MSLLQKYVKVMNPDSLKFRAETELEKFFVDLLETSDLSEFWKEKLYFICKVWSGMKFYDTDHNFHTAYLAMYI